MIKDRPQYTPEEIRQRAERWYARQIEILREIHGVHWERNRAWLEAYLKEDLRERLREIGWRRKP